MHLWIKFDKTNFWSKIAEYLHKSNMARQDEKYTLLWQKNRTWTRIQMTSTCLISVTRTIISTIYHTLSLISCALMLPITTTNRTFCPNRPWSKLAINLKRQRKNIKKRSTTIKLLKKVPEVVKKHLFSKPTRKSKCYKPCLRAFLDLL